MNRKATSFIVIAALIVSLFAIAAPVSAQDKLINTRADNVVIAKAKNGKDYVRITVTDDRQMSGLKYKAPISIMFFGDIAEQAKKIKAGQNVKCVVQTREFQGRTTYTAVAMAEQPKTEK